MRRSKESYSSLILLDMVAIFISYIVGYFIRFNQINKIFDQQIYRIGILCLLLVYVCIAFYSECLIDFLKRGNLRELVIILEVNFFLSVILMLLLYFLHISGDYSRGFFLSVLICNIILMYAFHVIYKKIILLHYSNKDNARKVLIAATTNVFPNILDDLKETIPGNYEIVGMVLLDKDYVGKTVSGFNIVANRDNMYDYIRVGAVDEVFISVMDYPSSKVEHIILTLQHMGVVVNVNISTFGLSVKEKMVREFGRYSVLTYSTNVFDGVSAFIKKIMDIVGGIVGLILTVLIGIIITPAIYIESPGPILFSQIRVGKNGRRFRIYKFRSMYMDAEERKNELMDYNEMNGLMFKMKDDPRITKVGKFIRKTSIDEFPQFWNVLIGDMSLVGTRPPTEDEFLQYDNEQKRRLSLKPGITGLWQVSGRSDITDFNEVISLDLEYIDNWSIKQDIRLILKTIRIVIMGKGAE